MTQELVGAGKMLSKGVLRAIWLEKNHCWREFVTFYYAFLESHSLPHHNFSQVQRSFLLWNIYSTLVPLPGEREIDTLTLYTLGHLDYSKVVSMFVCMFIFKRVCNKSFNVSPRGVGVDVDHGVEHWPCNPRVSGSIPGVGNLKKLFIWMKIHGLTQKS